MNRIVLWLLSTISVVVLLFGYHTSTSGPQAAQGTAFSSGVQPSSAGVTNGNGGTGGGSGGTGGGNGNGTASTGHSSAPTKVTGATANTRWGPVQVQLTVDSGTITRISLLQYPSGNSTDAQINSYALPILIQDTMNAQSANISMISGATVTSEGYLQSLQSALDQAGL